MPSNAMTARLIRCAVILAAILACLMPARAGAATPAEIDAAIERAKAFLYSKQKPAGNWENELKRRGNEHDFAGMQGDTFGGYTAVATYALLAAGDKPQNPRLPSLKAAIQFLETADILGIYALGMRANVWALLPPTAKNKTFSERDARLIMLGMQTGQQNPDAKGFWEYGNGRGTSLTGTSRFDHSVSQYGVLGLWACAENGVVVDRTVWQLIDAGWKSHQFTEGRWAYDSLPKENRQENPSMTAAGVATLFITDEMLNANRGIDCRGNIVNENIERGLKWMSDHLKDVDNNYGFYGVERIGAASGRKYFGNTDWFALGAEKIVRSQRPDGSWVGGFPGAENPVPTTAFALLFLVRGRAPLMMNKLQYDLNPAPSASAAIASGAPAPVEGNWNQRPRDAANLVRWTNYNLEKTYNWQIVNLSGATDDLHEAPILYMSGDQELRFTQEDEAKLQEYVESGGIILANADCGGTKGAFGKSFEAMGKRMFPRYDFRDLRGNHPIFTELYSASKWNGTPRLRGLSNGVRELMLLIPEADPARAWQIRTDPAQLASFQLGADIFLYVTDRQELGNRGESYLIRPDEDRIAERSARVARLMIGGNDDPEPGGWRRLAALIHNQYQLDTDVVNMKLDDKRLAGSKLAHLTGTGHFTLTAAQRQQLVAYVKQGGTLVVDAAGGNADFAESAEVELKSCFGSDAEAGLTDPLDPFSPIFRLPGANIGPVTYRRAYHKVVGKLTAPRINGIKIGNRIAVFYSREDLSAGMVGEPVGAIAGYSPQSATELMRNIVLYGAFGFRADGAR